LLDDLIKSQPLPFEPDKQRAKEAAMALKAILDARAKQPKPGLPTVEEFKKAFEDLKKK
jgi:hypothetical protein